MGLFDKFKIGLGKSSDGLSTGFKNIFSKKKIDENVLTEFEELIITSDAGIEVAKELRKDFENFKVDKKLEDHKEILKLLADKLAINLQKYEKASIFVKKAQAYISGEPYLISNKNNKEDLFEKIGSGFYIFDIESNPDEKHDFLYGFLKVNNLSIKKEDLIYEPILNLKNNKGESYRQIIEILFSHKEWPVLHYGETEKISIINIAKNLNFSDQEIDSLASRFIDLHTLIRKSWILPLKNYGLKTVSNWLGFEWMQKNVSGSKALYWWIQYQITENEIFLKKIIQYNKDDCLATLKIAEYLIKDQLKKN